MKSLIVLVVGLLSVGCCTMNPEQKSLRDSVIGEYELKDGTDTHKTVLLENGVREWYKNGKKTGESKWSIVDGKIHIKYDSGYIRVYRINTDKSITLIADIVDGKLTFYESKLRGPARKIK